MFLPNFMLFQIDYHRRHVGKPSYLSYRQALVENLISEKLGMWTWACFNQCLKYNIIGYKSSTIKI